MSLHVTLSASLRDYAPGYDPEAGLRLECAARFTPADLAGRLGIPPEAVKIVLVNGRRAEMTSPLEENSRVALFPALSGG
jgi:sulfur carrier protein ThiS